MVLVTGAAMLVVGGGPNVVVLVDVDVEVDVDVDAGAVGTVVAGSATGSVHTPPASAVSPHA